MKLILSLISSIAASTALACPSNLATTYKECVNQNNQSIEDKIISHSVQSGINIYTINDKTLVAHGQAIAVDIESFVGHITTTCQNNSLSVKLIGEIPGTGAITRTSSVERIENRLIIEREGSIVTSNGQTLPINELEECIAVEDL